MSKLINKYRQWCGKRWFKTISMLLKLFVALLIVWILLHKANVKKEDFAGVDLRWVSTALAAVMLQTLLTGVRWWFLMRAVGCKATLFEAVSLTLQGLFFTLFIPGGAVSGDLCKAALIAGKTPEGSKFQAAFSVFIDRVCGLCGLLLLSGISALLTLVFYSGTSPLFRSLLIVTVCAAPILLLCAVLAFRCDLILEIAFCKKLYDWLDKLSRGAISRIEAALAAYRPAWKTVLTWSLLSAFVMFPLIALAVWFICMGLPGSGMWSNVSCIAGSLLSGSIGELSGVLPLTPGGIGVRDAVFVEIFKACGLNVAISTQIPIVFTTLFMLTNSTGGLFLLLTLWSKRSKK